MEQINQNYKQICEYHKKMQAASFCIIYDTKYGSKWYHISRHSLIMFLLKYKPFVLIHYLQSDVNDKIVYYDMNWHRDEIIVLYCDKVGNDNAGSKYVQCLEPMPNDMEILRLFYFTRRRWLNYGPTGEAEYERVKRQILCIDEELKGMDKSAGMQSPLRRKIISLMWNKYLDGPVLITRSLHQTATTSLPERCDNN